MAIITGVLIFIGIESYIVLLIGLSAITWYNIVYTPLKKKTALAVFPGSLVGGAAPAIGWITAGGAFDTRLMTLCLFFVIWQIPHFLLLMVSHEEEYRKAGFPLITDIFSRESLKRVIFSWALAMIASGILIPYTNGYGSKYMLIAVFIIGFVLSWRMIHKALNNKLLMELNLYFLITSLLLAIDKLIFV
jgi:protoheme IX farnesyltransferase